MVALDDNTAVVALDDNTAVVALDDNTVVALDSSKVVVVAVVAGTDRHFPANQYMPKQGT